MPQDAQKKKTKYFEPKLNQCANQIFEGSQKKMFHNLNDVVKKCHKIRKRKHTHLCTKRERKMSFLA